MTRPARTTVGGGSGTQAAVPRWRWHTLLDAPHRVAFAAGAVMLAASGAWWAAVVVSRAAGAPVPFALPLSTVHALVMTFGFMPAFFAGFLFTMGPKWLRRPPAAASELAAPLALALAGWIVFLVAAHASGGEAAPRLAAAGLAAGSLGAIVIAWRFARMVAASTVADRLHARVIAIALAAGAAALGGAAFFVADGQAGAVRAIAVGAPWLFVGPVFVAASHRMLPFLDAVELPVLDARQPGWRLWTMAALLGLEGAAAGAEALGGTLPAWLACALAGVELVAAVALLGLALRFWRAQRLRGRLIRMLHLGFAWLGSAFALAGCSRLLAAATGGRVSLDLAPLHAYTMGFLGSTMLAMVSRVSAGLRGGLVADDRFVWRLFWLLQLAVLARVVAGVAAGTAAASATAASAATIVAALAWAAACVAWAARHLRWFGTPYPRDHVSR